MIISFTVEEIEPVVAKAAPQAPMIPDNQTANHACKRPQIREMSRTFACRSKVTGSRLTDRPGHRIRFTVASCLWMNGWTQTVRVRCK